MQPEKVDEMLMNYQQYVARCDYLKHIMLKLHQQEAIARAQMANDLVHITQTLSDMPHGSGTSDPTAKAGLKIASGAVTEQVADILEQIHYYEGELNEKSTTITYVESWLKCLNPIEKFVITNKTIYGMTWRELIVLFKNEFGVLYSKNGLRNILRSAMEKIYAIAK